MAQLSAQQRDADAWPQALSALQGVMLVEMSALGSALNEFCGWCGLCIATCQVVQTSLLSSKLAHKL